LVLGEIICWASQLCFLFPQHFLSQCIRLEGVAKT
jgi:hypothetical protein